MPNLLLGMTPGDGLNVWKRIGYLNRELKPYTEYVRRGWKVKILTYGSSEVPELPNGIEAVHFPYPRMIWPLLFCLLPLFHWKLGHWADVIKTNQSHRSFFYALAAKFWKRPMVLRCGYVQGEYLETTSGLTTKVRFYQWLEAKAFREAIHCEVPTRELAEWVQREYRVPAEKISVVPNFVDTEIFKPIEGIEKKEKSVIAVGRLASVKQYEFLIRACAEIPGCSLTIVGEGPERNNLEKLAEKLNFNLNLSGNIPNEQIPRVVQKHEVFAITSKREGHPKSLLEAMACGMPCLGVRATGISNMISHAGNGWLVEADVQSIKQGLSLILGNRALREDLARRAQRYATETYSFSRCFDLEYENMHRLVRT
jgi:glycosyltransferase involved in cell wall biosynthesis